MVERERDCPARPGCPPGARNMSSKSWPTSTSTSTPWLQLVSIPLRRLAQAGARSPDSAQGNGKLLGAVEFLGVANFGFNYLLI